MGYHTDFDGEFKITGTVTKEQIEYINEFSGTRRMKRDSGKAEAMEDPVRKAVGLDVGFEGQYFVGGTGFAGQDFDDSVRDGNRPPGDQPSLWCQWIVDEFQDNYVVQWDGGEKFYEYIPWIEYLIENFFKRWGWVLDGEVYWYGEESGDLGIIRIKNNKVSVLHGHVTYE